MARRSASTRRLPQLVGRAGEKRRAPPLYLHPRSAYNKLQDALVLRELPVEAKLQTSALFIYGLMGENHIGFFSSFFLNNALCLMSLELYRGPNMSTVQILYTVKHLITKLRLGHSWLCFRRQHLFAYKYIRRKENKTLKQKNLSNKHKGEKKNCFIWKATPLLQV